MDMERDWPLVAAGVAAVIGVVVVAKGGGGVTNVPVTTGTRSADYQAALQAEVAMSQARIQGQTALASALISGYVQTQAQIQQTAQAEMAYKAKLAEIDMQRASIAGQQAVQSQSNLLGFLGGVVPLLFGLFCEDETDRALVARRVASGRWQLAWGGA
jgi:hypothetical protein